MISAKIRSGIDYFCYIPLLELRMALRLCQDAVLRLPSKEKPILKDRDDWDLALESPGQMGITMV